MKRHWKKSVVEALALAILLSGMGMADDALPDAAVDETPAALPSDIPLLPVEDAVNDGAMDETENFLPFAAEDDGAPDEEGALYIPADATSDDGLTSPDEEAPASEDIPFAPTEEAAAADYSITIPAMVEMDRKTGTGSLTLSASGIAEGERVSVSIASQNGFHLLSGQNALEYTISGSAAVSGSENDLVIAFDANDSITLRLATVSTPTGTGVYQDVLTFSVNEN